MNLWLYASSTSRGITPPSPKLCPLKLELRVVGAVGGAVEGELLPKLTSRIGSRFEAACPEEVGDAFPVAFNFEGKLDLLTKLKSGAGGSS